MFHYADRALDGRTSERRRRGPVGFFKRSSDNGGRSRVVLKTTVAFARVVVAVVVVVTHRSRARIIVVVVIYALTCRARARAFTIIRRERPGPDVTRSRRYVLCSRRNVFAFKNGILTFRPQNAYVPLLHAILCLCITHTYYIRRIKRVRFSDAEIKRKKNKYV